MYARFVCVNRYPCHLDCRLVLEQLLLPRLQTGWMFSQQWSNKDLYSKMKVTKSMQIDASQYFCVYFLLVRYECVVFICASWCEKGIYRIYEQQRLRQTCASTYSWQRNRCSLTQCRELEEASWVTVHARLKENEPYGTEVPFLMKFWQHLSRLPKNPECSGTRNVWDTSRKNVFRRFSTRSDSNQPALLQKVAGVLKFRI